jgi:phosphate transport system permease protein
VSTNVVASIETDRRSAALTGRRSLGDRAFARVALIAGLSVLAILLLIAWSTTKEAWPILRTHAGQFFFTARWAPASGHYGALALVYGTMLTAVIALVFAVPVSIGIALFTTELAPPWLRKPLVSVMDILAVIPSVVFGLWGILVLAKPAGRFYTSIAKVAEHIPVVGHVFGRFAGTAAGSSFFTAGLILAIMIVPIISSLTREVIATTPASEKEAALALGATRWEMIRGAVFPHSKGGIVGAVTLGLGRAMGETIAVALVIGASPQISSHLFAPGYSLPSIIANEFGDADPIKRAALIGCGVMLFALTIVVNVAANAIVQRSIKRTRGA